MTNQKTPTQGYNGVPVAKRTDHGIFQDEINCGVAGAWYKGNLRTIFPLILFGGGCFIAVYGGFRFVKNEFDAKQKKRDTDEKLRFIKGKLQIETAHKSKIKENLEEPMNLDSGLVAVENPENELILWSEKFDQRFNLDIPSLPPVVLEMSVDCPCGYEPAVIATITTLLASCFSMVKAKYLDGNYHRPNLATVIEGQSGSGKGHFKRMNDMLFARRISRDFNLVGVDEEPHIIQNLSSNISQSRMIDILANNMNVHAIIFETEVKSMVNAMKRANGLNYDLLCKAFDNELIGRMNKDKTSPQGCFPVALNMVMTGTPGDIKKFIKDDAIEGGNASRIAWCTIPPAGRELPVFKNPDGVVLERIQNQIDEWTMKYSFYTDRNGKDVPAEEFEIDLSYVNTALKQWLDSQYDQGTAEKNEERKHIRARIGAMAFHCAIVYHMLYGNPGANSHKKRDDVVALTIYMANYFMERYLHKFASRQNELHSQIANQEMVVASTFPSVDDEEIPSKPSLPEDPEEKNKMLYELNKYQGISFNALGEMFGITKDAVAGDIRRYRKNHNLDDEHL